MEILVNKKTRKVNGDRLKIGNDGENLQEILVFKFEDEFVNGQARLEYEIKNVKNFITMTKVNETYTLPIKSILTKEGVVYFQLVIDEGTNDENIPIFKSDTFPVIVNSSINAINEAPEGYDQWIEIANAKLNQIDNLDIEATKENNVATITITKKDGTEESVNIFDGEKGETGDTGPSGPAGKDGKDGQDGYTPIKSVDYFTQQDIESLNIPRKTSDLNNDSGFINKDVNNLTYYELKTATGNNILMTLDSSTYVLTLSLRNSANQVLNTQSVDLPLETMVVSGSYDSANKKIVLTLKNGSTIDIPVGDLISGLQSEITSNNKLLSDLVDDTNQTNKFVSSSEKQTWNAKSNFSGDYNDLQNKPTNVSSFTNDAGYLTQHQDISGKQDKMQFATMPTASSDLLGQIVEFIGTTDSTYTNGYFYKCLSDGEVTPTYSWERIDVQPSGGDVNITSLGSVGKQKQAYPDWFACNYYTTQANAYDITGIKAGTTLIIPTFMYDYSGEMTGYLYLYFKVKINGNYVSTYIRCYQPIVNEILCVAFTEDVPDTIPSQVTYLATFVYDNNDGRNYNALKLDTSGNLSFTSVAKSSPYVLAFGTNSNQTINGYKFFNQIPKQSNTNAPTLDTQFTNKKYVDDQISAQIGNINTILATLTTPSSVSE